MRTTTRWALRLSSLAAAAAASYPFFFREWCVNWGATDDEIGRPMPGDELLPAPGISTNRAITVHAPASAVWPWLVQMGPGRGGAYTYDWIENLLGLDMHSADAIVPEFQHMAVGDVFPMGSGPALRVAILEPERALVLRSEDGRWIWAFGLYPADDGTRLVSRNRIVAPGSPPARLLYTLFMEPGSLVMERKMLLGIRERAERLARESAGPAAAAAAESRRVNE